MPPTIARRALNGDHFEVEYGNGTRRSFYLPELAETYLRLSNDEFFATYGFDWPGGYPGDYLKKQKITKCPG
jgi:hypothetical protein